MKNELALRYLLLRHLEQLEDRVPHERLREVMESLRVEPQGRTGYVVRYRDGGNACEHRFPFDAFTFYERGDTRPEQRSLDDDLGNRNDELARAFAEHIFGARLPPQAGQPAPPLEAMGAAALTEMVAFPLAVGLAGSLGASAMAALLALGLAEFAPRGRLLSSLLFCIVALLGPASASALGALAYGFLQWLDPNSQHRKSRVGLCAAAIVLAVAGPAPDGEITVGIAAVSLTLLATVLSGLRSLYTSHFRALTLALPFYCAGLAVAGEPRAALAGLAILSLGTLVAVAGHRLAPVQGHRT